MKIIITASSKDINQPFNPRFGRADTFLLFDSDSKEWSHLANPASRSSGGAGPQAVEFISRMGGDVVVSGRFGPKAVTALQAAGMKAYTALTGTVSEVLEQYLNGQLKQVG
jgi:predicted Fe-Mo cluster-binding NifX family protein